MSRLLPVAAVVVASLVPSLAEADDEEEAQALFEEGVEAFQRGDLESARARYEASLALHPTAAAAFNLAGVLMDLQRPMAARALYEELLRGVYGELADEQRGEVETLSRQAEESVAEIEVRVTSPSPVTIYVDNGEVGTTDESAPVLHSVEPGTHLVRGVRQHDGVEQERRVNVRPGGVGRALLRFVEPEPAATEASAPVVTVSPDRARPPDDAGGGVSPWVFVAAGALVVAAGVVTLLLVSSGEDEPGTTLPATATLLSF